MTYSQSGLLLPHCVATCCIVLTHRCPGMNAVSHGPLVAAVTNAGGLGVLGGLTMSIATRHATLSNGDSACYADLGSTKDAAAADRRREGQPDLADRKVRRRSRHSAGWKLHVQTLKVSLVVGIAPGGRKCAQNELRLHAWPSAPISLPTTACLPRTLVARGRLLGRCLCINRVIYRAPMTSRSWRTSSFRRVRRVATVYDS